MKTKIYIIEDNEIVRYLLRHTLEEQFDAEVCFDTNVQSIYSDISEIQPEIVILDYHLRFDNIILSADLVLKDIRNMSPLSDIIVFSGQRDKNTAINLLKNGAVNYVSKDSDSFHSDIIDAVREVLDYRQTELTIRNNIKKVKNTIAWTIAILVTVISTGVITFSTS